MQRHSYNSEKDTGRHLGDGGRKLPWQLDSEKELQRKFNMKVKVKWDTDGEVIPELPEIVDIPANVDFEDVSDWLTDKYGFCHFSWSEI